MRQILGKHECLHVHASHGATVELAGAIRECEGIYDDVLPEVIQFGGGIETEGEAVNVAGADGALPVGYGFNISPRSKFIGR